MTTLCVALCCGVIFFAACKKKDNSSPKKKLLLAGKWQLSGRVATTTYMGKDTTIDVYPTTDACDKDDFILFADNGSGTVDENADKCADDQQIENFTWVLLNNDTRLAIMDSNPDTMDLEIASTQMQVKITTTNSSGVPLIYSETYKNIR